MNRNRKVTDSLDVLLCLNILAHVGLAYISLDGASDALLVMQDILQGTDEDIVREDVEKYVKDAVYVPLLIVGAALSNQVTRRAQQALSKDTRDAALGFGWLIFVGFYLWGMAYTGSLFPGSWPCTTSIILLALLYIVVEPVVEHELTSNSRGPVLNRCGG